MKKLTIGRLRQRAEEFAELYFENMSTVYPVEMTAGQGGKKSILVLTPHADDETFGAGGAIRFHIENGDAVHVAMFSDNLASIPDRRDSEDQSIAMREREFYEAMDVLGVDSTTVFRIKEKDFKQNWAKNENMNRLFVENQPDVLYLPSLFDNHQDHRIVNVWAGFALKHQPHKDILIRGYEVWTPLPATAVLDITPFFDLKQQAIRCYRSQLQSIRYDHHITGLNAYRAMTLGRRAAYAEAFFEAPAPQYLKLVKQYLAS